MKQIFYFYLSVIAFLLVSCNDGNDFDDPNLVPVDESFFRRKIWVTAPDSISLSWQYQVIDVMIGSNARWGYTYKVTDSWLQFFDNKNDGYCYISADENLNTEKRTAYIRFFNQYTNDKLCEINVTQAGAETIDP